MDYENFFDATPGSGCGGTDDSGTTHDTELDCSIRTIYTYERSFTGAIFDSPLDPYPNDMTAADLLAVGGLSMKSFRSLRKIESMQFNFEADATRSETCTNADCKKHFKCVLERVPTSIDVYQLQIPSSLWDDINTLWTLIGPLVEVTTNAPASRTKPLARKRSSLIPILDKEGSIANQNSKGVASGNYWKSIVQEMQAGQTIIQAGCAAIRNTGVGGAMSDLRIVDVLVWMYQTRPSSRCG